MNITDSIAKQIGGEIEILINDNKEIQFYANGNINSYQWRDGRYSDTSDVWENGEEVSRKDLIDTFLSHLKFYS